MAPMTIPDWRGMRRKLFLRRLFDPVLTNFGADEHHYRLNPPISIDEVITFETRHGVTLPDDYRHFLLQAGNGGAGPAYGLLPLSDDLVWGALAKPFALTEAWDQADCQGPEDEIPDRYRDGCLQLCELGCGYWSFLVVTGEAAGSVWDDYTCAGTGIHPTGHTFSTWYTQWLRRLIMGQLAS
jgi:hypothetical protein